MDAMTTDQPDRLSVIHQWVAENKTRCDDHPCYADLLNRIQSIEQLQQELPTRQPPQDQAESIGDPALSLQTMMLAVQLDRCEAMIENLQYGTGRGKANEVEKILYPSFSLAVLQHIIHMIVGLKTMLGFSDKTYKSVNLLHLCYLKSPPRLTKLISRLLPKLW